MVLFKMFLIKCLWYHIFGAVQNAEFKSECFGVKLLQHGSVQNAEYF